MFHNLKRKDMNDNLFFSIKKSISQIFKQTVDGSISEPFFRKKRNQFLLLLLLSMCSIVQVNAQCTQMSFNFQQFEPCKYRTLYQNTTECYTQIRLALNQGNFSTFTINTAAGFKLDFSSSNEIWISHNQGFLPLGNQGPVIFTLPYDLTTSISVAYINDCPPGTGCELFPPPVLESCPAPTNASISGVKYRECNQAAFTNQAMVPDWMIRLYNIDNVLITETTTDNTGTYAFYDLPPGQYYCREAITPGWTSSVPASGEYLINLAASQQAVRNFGNCPTCTCDSLYVNIDEQPGMNDTSKYFLTVQNSGEFCFPYIDIKVDTGQLLNWDVLITGWKVEPQGANTIRLLPPGNYIVKGGFIPLCFSVSGLVNHVFTTSTGLGGQASCSKVFPFPFPIIPVPKDCCPKGNNQGTDLVTNGNFSNTIPFVGYGSQYNYSAGGTGAGHFAIMNGTLATAANGSFWGAIGKSGNPNTDYFMVVDGSTAANTAVWFQNVTLLANTDYKFSALVNNLVRPNLNFSNPQIILQIVDNNGTGAVVAQSSPLDLGENPNAWRLICLDYKTPANPNNNYRLRILSTSTNGSGNDFALDCISMRSCMAPVCTSDFNVVAGCNGKFTFNGFALIGTAPFTYTWNFGDNTPIVSGANSSVMHTYATFGTSYTVTLVVTDAAGCSSTTQVQITVPPFQSVAISGNSNICAGQSTTLTANATTGSTFLWSPGGATTPFITVSPTTSTTYCVTATHTNGCTSSTCVVVNVTQIPLTITPNQTICKGQSTLLTANGGVGSTYFWTPGGATTPSITVSPATTTTYTVVATNSGCTASATTVVTVSNPTTFITGNPGLTVCPGASTTLTAGNGPWANCQWNTSATGNSIIVTIPGTYCVTCTNSNGCTASACVVVGDCCQCPAGSIAGPELIQNGNFSTGFTGFTSDYAQIASCSPQRYYIADHTNVQAMCAGEWDCIDHTTGAPSAPFPGNFFVADGDVNTSLDLAAWRSVPMTLNIGTSYNLCAWVNNLDIPGTNSVLPIVQAYLVDQGSSTSYSLGTVPTPESPDVWVKLSASWVAPTTGPFVLEFRTGSTGFFGNNFALDDISFRACTSTMSCTCGTFSNMLYRPAQGAMSIPITCGDSSLISNCSAPGNWGLSGIYMCQGTNCPPNTPMFWNLYDPANQVVANSIPGMVASPNFSLTIPNSNFATGGVYTLVIGAICGTDTCYCTYYIYSQGCPCCSANYQQFLANAQNAFNVIADGILCKATVNVNNLNTCHRFDWIQWGDGNQSFGPFPNGSMPMHTYTAPGTYTITALILEINPITGLICYEAVLTDSVKLACCAPRPDGMISWWPMEDMDGDIDATDIMGPHHANPNTGFIGNGSGPTVITGKVNNALEFNAAPVQYLEVPSHPDFNFGSGSFAIDAWIFTNGGTQSEPIVHKAVFLSGLGYYLNVEGTTLSNWKVTLSVGNGTTMQYFSGPPIVLGQWNFVAVSVDAVNQTVTLYSGTPSGSLAQITLSTAPLNASSNAPLRIAYNPQNPKWNIAIDELEIFNKSVSFTDFNNIYEADAKGKCDPSIVSIDQPAYINSVRLYPNPNSGDFIVELPLAATEEMRFVITDITGRWIFEKSVETGLQSQIISANNLQPGLYFLQILSKGKIVAVKKFVKQ